MKYFLNSSVLICDKFQRQGESGLGNAILLSAVFKALCEGPIRLTSIFPFYGGCDTPDIQQSLWQSDSSTGQQDTLNLSDYGQHARSPPDLMISSYCYSFKEVLDRILSIASFPAVCVSSYKFFQTFC